MSRRGLTAAAPVENPYCSCKLTRVRPFNTGNLEAAGQTADALLGVLNKENDAVKEDRRRR